MPHFVRLALAALLALLPAAAFQAARPPLSEGAIPVYGGFAEVPDEAGVFDSTRHGVMLEERYKLALLARKMRLFQARVARENLQAAFERASAFYEQSLGGPKIDLGCSLSPADERRIQTQERQTEAEIASLKPGSTSPVWRSCSTWWWFVREQNGNVTGLSVVVDGGETTLSLRTVEERFGPLRAIPAPQEAELGLPVYPGAEYQPKLSLKSEILGDTHIFATRDGVEQVRAFYEKTLGEAKRAGPDGTADYFWPEREWGTEMKLVLSSKDAEPPARTCIEIHVRRPQKP